MAQKQKKQSATKESVSVATAAAKSSLPKPPRRLRLATYKSFKLQKKIAPIDRKKIPAAPKLFWRAGALLVRHWKLFAGIGLVYAVLDIVFVGGIGGAGDLTQLKNSLENAFTGHFSRVSVGITLFGFLIGNIGASNSSEQSPGLFQALLLLVISLGLIWTLRRIYTTNAQKVRIRDAFYEGPRPLVTFMLVLCVMALQLLPLIIGVLIYNFASTNGLATDALERILTIVIAFLLSVLTLYMLCSSIFALYIVTLPEMTPIKALRSARKLVRYRRFTILRKILFLPVALLVIAAIIMSPIALFLTPASTIIFFLLTVIGIMMVHSYMYGLYRELLV